MNYRDQYAALLEAIADEADSIATKFFRDATLQIERKRDGTRVTAADRAVEEMARARVAASGLPLDVLGEEMGGESPDEAGKSERARLIIDPIDGTEEFSRGIPTFGTLLAIEHRARIVAGMCSAPALATRWCAYRGSGSFRNGHTIHVSKTSQLADAMIFTTGTGPKKSALHRERLRRLADASRGGRALGGFWQHMLVAEGAIDVAVDLTSQPWDLAPLGIIVEEAGGRSTNLNGEPSIYTKSLISTNGKLHDQVLGVLCDGER